MLRTGFVRFPNNKYFCLDSDSTKDKLVFNPYALVGVSIMSYSDLNELNQGVIIVIFDM